MHQPPKIPDQDTVKALEATNGNVSKAAQLLSQKFNIPVSRHWLDARCKSQPALARILQDIRDSFIDEAEDVVTEHVTLQRDLGAAQFILRTLGRDRGYVPKVEASVNLTVDQAETLRTARQRTMTSPPEFTKETELSEVTDQSHSGDAVGLQHVNGNEAVDVANS